MKRFTAITLAALMVLTVFASVIPATAATVDSVEIRGPVYDGANFAAIFATDGVNDTGDFDYYLEMNSTTFAGFYYDLDTGASTEVLRIYNTTTNGAVTVATGKVLDEDAIEYNTTITAVEYEFGDTGDAWDGTTYNVIGIFAEEFIPLTATTPDKVAKLLVDSDDKTTLRTGQALELGGGYAITAQQVDVEGNKVWLELTKDGEFVEDEIVDLTGAAGAGANWTYTPDIEDEDNVEVMKVFVSDVFQGQVDSLAVIEAVWLMAFDDVRIIEDDDKFGVFEVAVGTSSLVFTNPNSITLSENTVKDLAEGMSFKVADDVGTDLRFYLMKEHTEPGTYEVRGTVVEDAGSTWTAADFAGFYYNLDDDVSTETLTISGISNNDRSIEEDELSYNTSIQSVGFEFGDAGDAWAADTYDVIAIFAEEFIPLTATTPDKVAKLLVDSDDKTTLRTGQARELGGGYAITAQQVDVEGNKVWLELSKDGEFVEDEIVDLTGATDGANWTYTPDIEDEDNVEVMRVFVSDVFQGQVDSLAVIEAVWLMAFDDVRIIEDDDKFGVFEVTLGDTFLNFTNPNTVTLTENSVKDLAEGMKIKVADDDDATIVRYYPFIEMTISGEVVDEEVVDEEVVDEEVVDEEVVDEEVVDEVVDEEVVDEVVDEEVVDEVVDDEADEEPVEEEPGFEAIFAIAGLLAVAFLVRRD